MAVWKPVSLLLAVVVLLGAFPGCPHALELTPEQAQNVELLGHVGGACHAVAVSTTRVLIGQGPRLTSVDVSSPTRPIERASFLLPGMVKDIAISGNVACVLADQLWFLDASDTQTLRELSHLPMSGERLAAFGTIVYILGLMPSIQIVDIRYPTMPRLVEILDLPHGSIDFVEAKAFLPVPPYAYVVYMRRYLATLPSIGGFSTLDISDPKTPSVLDDTTILAPLLGAGLHNHVLYCLMDKMILPFDVSNPLAPAQRSAFSSPSSSREITFMGNRAFVVGGNSDIWSYDLSGTQPRELLRVSTSGEAVRFAALDTFLLVADGWTGLRVYGAAKTDAVTELGSLATLSEASDVAIAGQHAYVTDNRLGVRAYDLADPDRPAEIARFQTSGPAQRIAVNGATAYVSEAESGFEVLDIRNPSAPTRIAAYDTTGSVQSIAFLSDFALVADGPGGLLLVRVADPTHPVLFGRSDAPGWAESVVGAVNRVFVGDRSLLSGVWKLDVSSPGFPRVMDELPGIGGGAMDLALAGEQLCVAEADQGFWVVNTNPGRYMYTAGRLPTAGSPQGVAFDGALGYVADSNFGLRVANLLDPFNGSEAGYLATAGAPAHLALANGRIYLAAGEAGLYVLRFRWSPDLVIRGFESDTQDVTSGTELGLHGEVANNSTTPTAAAFSVKILVSPWRDFSEPRLLLCPPLRVEAGMSFLYPINLAKQRLVVLGDVPHGVYRLGIVVDADNEVAEFREDNNVTWLDRSFYMGARPARAQCWQLYR